MNSALATASGLVQRGLFAIPWIQVAIIYVEVILGFWFLLAKSRYSTWLSAVALFICFSAVNLFQGLEGEASCGCFGPVRANPWIVFTGDLAVLGLLAICRPAIDGVATQSDAKRFLILNSGLFLFVATLLGSLNLAFGGWERLSATLRGEPFSLSPSVVDFGPGAAGDIKDAEITITNLSDKPMRVVGATSSCSFIATGNLPVTIQPGESQRLNLRLIYPYSSGRFHHRGVYYLDLDGLSKVGFQLTGISRSVE